MSRKRKRRVLDRHYDELMRVYDEVVRVVLPCELRQSKPICVDVTNVFRWVHSQARSWSIKEEFPCIAPPWPWAWFEYDTGITAPSAIGCMFLGGEAQGDLRERARWACLADLWVELSKRRVKMVGRAWLPIAEDGALIIEESELQVDSLVGTDYFHTRLIPIFLALLLLNCENVSWEDLPAAPRFARKARKQKNRGDVVYKTLVIDAFKRQARQAAQEEGSTGDEIKQAMHIVRGHFKDYRDGPGLFGKLKGLYWWQMHVRGDAEFGEIDKDYEVKPPKGGDDDGDNGGVKGRDWGGD